MIPIKQPRPSAGDFKTAASTMGLTEVQYRRGTVNLCGDFGIIRP